MRATLFLVVAACVLAVSMAFAPATLPTLRTMPKATSARSPLRMSASEEPDGKPKDMSKGNDPISILVDSVKRLFSKTNDDYPQGDGQGFTQTPKKPTRNKGEW